MENLSGIRRGSTQCLRLLMLGLCALSIAGAATNLTIPIPRHTAMTPVQRLNSEGVQAVKRHHYEKAADLFYKAYLFDPADPFTLNNLGYISEIQGNLERAQKFYTLAAQQGCQATIAHSNLSQLRGKPMSAAFYGLHDAPMQVNRMNVDAMAMLSSKRGAEAAVLLTQALRLDSQNPFTRNNLAVAHEALGDYAAAARDYAAVAADNSKEAVVVTASGPWRGHTVSQIAEESGRRLQLRISTMKAPATESAMWDIQGVTAVNQNNWTAARKAFLQAYEVAPNDSFALNNRGYIAEKDGDPETAHFFYAKARRASEARHRIGLATSPEAEGQKLSAVSRESDRLVESALDASARLRHTQPGPAGLTSRPPIPVDEKQESPTASLPPTEGKAPAARMP